MDEEELGSRDDYDAQHHHHRDGAPKPSKRGSKKAQAAERRDGGSLCS